MVYTKNFDEKVRQLTSRFKVCHAFTSEPIPEHVEVLGLWDTGMTYCSISQSIVDRLKLVPFKDTLEENSTGNYTTPVYRIHICLVGEDGTDYWTFLSLQATLSQMSGVDLIVGMGLISRGNFSVFNDNNKTSISFGMSANPPGNTKP